MSKIKKLFAVITVAVLIIQAGVSTVFAAIPQESKQVITISNINSPLLQTGSGSSSTMLRTSGLPSDAIDIVSEEWSCSDDIVISGDNIEIKGGKYSYKLTLRANGTLTFDNDLEISYQGINCRYQLNYEIDETDNHIMIVTGAFDNIIIASPLLDKIPDKNKKQLLSRISEDKYFYQLILKTAEGLSFENTLRFLFDSKPFGYSLFYAYDLLTDRQKLIISSITDLSDTDPAISSEKEKTADPSAYGSKHRIGAKSVFAKINAINQESKKTGNKLLSILQPFRISNLECVYKT